MRLRESLIKANYYAFLRLYSSSGFKSSRLGHYTDASTYETTSMLLLISFFTLKIVFENYFVT